PLPQGGQDGDTGVKAGEHVDEGYRRLNRVAVRLSRHGQQAGLGLHGAVVTRLGCPRTGLPEARYREVHHARVGCRHALVVEPVALEVAKLEVLHHHIGAPREIPNQTRPALVLEVHRQALLAAVHGEVIAALAFYVRRAPAARVIALGRLHLDHPGTEVCQHLRAVGPSQHAAEVEYQQVTEHMQRVYRWAS